MIKPMRYQCRPCGKPADYDRRYPGTYNARRVRTSDRKLRMFTARDHLGLLWRFLRQGRGVLRSRDHLGLWYDKRHDRN